VYGTAGDPLLGRVVDEAVGRVFWLAEGLHGAGGVDFPRLRALAAARDALRHAERLLTLTRAAAMATAARIAADTAAPADLRGAALGVLWSLGPSHSDAQSGHETLSHAEAARQARSLAAAAPEMLGDWLAGLFALARDEVTGRGSASGSGDRPSLLDALDEIVTALTGDDFLIGLPALRQAFAFFPPRERERIAERLLERRGRIGSARSLLRTSADPLLLARARNLEENVVRLLDRHGLRVQEAGR
jgi:hypothetical protein